MTVVSRAGRHTAQVRYKGVSVAQTFESRTAASRWEGRVKAAVDEGRWPDKDLVPPHLWGKWGLVKAVAEPVDDAKPNPGWTLDKALAEYKRTVADHTKGWKQTGDRIAAWRARPVAARRLDDPELRKELQAHIGARLAAGRANNTVRNEIFLLSALYTHATADDIDETGTHGWGLTDLVNPCGRLVLPPPPRPRRRRLQDGDGSKRKSEEDRLRAALAAGPDGVAMITLFELAIETAMRLSEVLDVRCGQIRSSQGIRYIERPDSKSGDPRHVVLSTRAAAAVDSLLATLPDDADDADERLFKLNVPAVEYRWRLARNAANVTGLRWHDLRHEGLSRMASKRLSLDGLKQQSGHRTVQVLLSYIHEQPSEIAEKLG